MKAIPVVCSVKEFRMLTPTVFHLSFDTDQDITFEAGQFISIVIPGAGPSGRDLRRAYSIASAPEQRPIELCVKLVEKGPGTNYLIKLRPGDTFKGMAPYGDFVYKTQPDKKVCFISTGTGIAPFRSMIHSEALKALPPKELTCLLGVRGDEELLYTEELTQYAISQNLKLNYVTCVSGQISPSYKGLKGRVTQYLRETPQDFLNTEYYLCGAGAMIDEVKKILADQGVTKEQIHQEVYYKEPKV